jgi:hypothetical protein
MSNMDTTKNRDWNKKKTKMAVKNRQSRGIRYKTQTEQNKNKTEKNPKQNKSKKQSKKQN